MRTSGRRTGLLRVTALLALLLAWCWAAFGPKAPPEAPEVPSPPVALQPLSAPEAPAPDPKAALHAYEDDGIPDSRLYVSEERQTYRSGDLRLVIPLLSLDTTLYDGTTPSMFNRGVCLYEYASLPGRGNRNVSIAGHRNNRRAGVVTDDAPFYYVDRLGEGDFLYLADGQFVHRYVYETTYVVKETDWSPIFRQGFSCLTITSCEPIGVNTHRIVVVARLDDIAPAGEQAVFYENIQALQAAEQARRTQLLAALIGRAVGLAALLGGAC